MTIWLLAAAFAGGPLEPGLHTLVQRDGRTHTFDVEETADHDVVVRLESPEGSASLSGGDETYLATPDDPPLLVLDSGSGPGSWSFTVDLEEAPVVHVWVALEEENPRGHRPGALSKASASQLEMRRASMGTAEAPEAVEPDAAALCAVIEGRLDELNGWRTRGAPPRVPGLDCTAAADGSDVCAIALEPGGVLAACDLHRDEQTGLFTDPPGAATIGIGASGDPRSLVLRARVRPTGREGGDCAFDASGTRFRYLTFDGGSLVFDVGTGLPVADPGEDAWSVAEACPSVVVGSDRVTSDCREARARPVLVGSDGSRTPFRGGLVETYGAGVAATPDGRYVAFQGALYDVATRKRVASDPDLVTDPVVLTATWGLWWRATSSDGQTYRGIPTLEPVYPTGVPAGRVCGAAGGRVAYLEQVGDQAFVTVHDAASGHWMPLQRPERVDTWAAALVEERIAQGREPRQVVAETLLSSVPGGWSTKVPHGSLRLVVIPDSAGVRPEGFQVRGDSLVDFRSVDFHEVAGSPFQAFEYGFGSPAGGSGTVSVRVPKGDAALLLVRMGDFDGSEAPAGVMEARRVDASLRWSLEAITDGIAQFHATRKVMVADFNAGTRATEFGERLGWFVQSREKGQEVLEILEGLHRSLADLRQAKADGGCDADVEVVDGLLAELVEIRRTAEGVVEALRAVEVDSEGASPKLDRLGARYDALRQATFAWTPRLEQIGDCGLR
ncbi:MAG: hypothetical protein H6737_06295 [Alphaproteobacteria bacterium]|nr:hypothetical protein [Alphaproteobacteria bacterium]